MGRGEPCDPPGDQHFPTSFMDPWDSTSYGHWVLAVSGCKDLPTLHLSFNQMVYPSPPLPLPQGHLSGSQDSDVSKLSSPGLSTGHSVSGCQVMTANLHRVSQHPILRP